MVNHVLCRLEVELDTCWKWALDVTTGMSVMTVKEQFCWIGDGEVGRLKTINRKLRHWKLDYKGEKQFSLKNIIYVLGCSHPVMFDSLQPHGLKPDRLLCPWDFTGKLLKSIAISFSRGSSWPRDQNCIISNVSYIDKWIFYHLDTFIYFTVLGLI